MFRAALALSFSVCTFVASATPVPCGLVDYATIDCYARLEAQTLKKYRLNLSRSGLELRVVALNGKVLTYVSAPDGQGYEEMHNYAVIGVLEPGRFAVVLDGRWEGRDVFLVSLNDGAVYPINGMPLVSPDRKRIAIHSQDLDANYDSNFLAVYRLDGSTLVKEIVLDGDSDRAGLWGPARVKWKSGTRLSFSRVRHSPSGPEYIFEPWLLDLENGAWKAKPAT